MSTRPFLSVVMPLHNGAEWLAATFDSLASEHAGDIEVIAIDSSASEDTASIVERYAARLPLKLIRRPDVMPWQTKTNMGVELAAAEHICMLHQDDLWLPGRVETIHHWIANAPQAALHLAPTLIVDRNGRKVGRWTCPLPKERLLAREFVLERLLVQNFVSVPAPVFRRDAWLECRGMDEQLWYTPDWDIWVKLSSAGPVIYHEEVTTAFRVHGGSLTVTGSRDAREFREQMQIVLDRHLDQLSANGRHTIERIARASIDVNASLAAASGGSLRALVDAAAGLLALGPVAMARYLRDSRLYERVVARVRARMTGAF